MFKFRRKSEKVEIEDKKFSKGAPENPASIQDELRHTAELASACLGSPLFKRYREKLERIEKELINDILKDADEFERSDITIETYGIRVLTKSIKLRDARSLLNDVNKDIARGNRLSDEKEEENGH